jgi:hypothetical protein
MFLFLWAYWISIYFHSYNWTKITKVIRAYILNISNVIYWINCHNAYVFLLCTLSNMCDITLNLRSCYLHPAGASPLHSLATGVGKGIHQVNNNNYRLIKKKQIFLSFPYFFLSWYNNLLSIFWNFVVICSFFSENFSLLTQTIWKVQKLFENKFQTSTIFGNAIDWVQILKTKWNLGFEKLQFRIRFAFSYLSFIDLNSPLI